MMRSRSVGRGWPAIALLALSAFGGEAPYRPFPDQPDILYFENFETDKNVFVKGQVHAGDPCPRGGRAYKLGEADWGRNDRWVFSQVELKNTPVRVPGGLDPRAVGIQVLDWTDLPGDLVIKPNYGNGDYQEAVHVTQVKTWVPVAVRFSDLRGKNKPEPSHVAQVVDVSFKPQNKVLPNVYIDSFLITVGTPPAQVLSRLMAREAKAVALKRKVEADGYSFSLECQEALKNALKNVRRPKRTPVVLVVGPRTTDGQEWARGLTQAGQNVRYTALSFQAGIDPRGDPLAGLPDMRTLLRHALRQSGADWALLVLSAKDAGEKPAESLRPVLERTLALGAAPVVCLPPAAPGNEQVTRLIGDARALCEQLGVPTLDPAFALKNVPDAVRDGELTVAGIESAAGLAITALKHFQESVKN
jgi:hypothetical protein